MVPAVVGVLGAAACSSGGGSGGVTLSFSFLSSVATSPYQMIADEYAKSHPGVKFRTQPTTSDQYGQVLRTQLQAGNAPDLLFVQGGSGDTYSILPFVDAGYLLPLTGQPAEELVKSTGSESLYTKSGTTFGQPMDLAPATVNINKTAYDAAGLQVPATLSGVLQNCDGAKAAGKALFNYAGASPLNDGLTAMEIAASRVY